MAPANQSNASLHEIAALLRAGDDFVICGHVSPDGDCLGSQLALWHALRALGKRATCVLARDEPVNHDLAFLPGIDQIVPAAGFDGPCGVFVGVDVPIRSRIGDAARLLDASDVSLTIDHHAADERMCDWACIDPAAASASMLVWDLVKLLADDVPGECALCCYVGLVTDTGGFRFQNSDARAFEVASELVGHGVSPSDVAARVFQNRTLASLKLEGLVIDRMRVSCDGQAVTSWVGQRDLVALGATKADTEPLVNTLRELAGARVACFLRETPDGVRGSLRAKDGTNVAALARELGGGGHAAAAGFTLHASLEDALESMGERLRILLEGAERTGA